MKAAFYREQIEQLIERVKQNDWTGSAINMTLPARNHTEPDRLARERELLA
ncbi:MAG: hypothetical protein HKO71_01165, partial [Pseudomonadales bacterium]|nr:hypothetical protein [Pseudomonadales bacterium]